MNRGAIRATLCAVALVSCFPGQGAAQSAWTELRGDNFVLAGTLDAGALNPIACEVQQVLRALGLPREGAPIPSIIATTNEREMRELLPQYWERRGARPLGGYWAGLYGHHIAVRVDARPEERMRRLLHEVAHFSTHATGSEPALWLDEGISELWEHAAVEGRHIEIGRPVPRHLRDLRSDRNWIPVAEMLSAQEIPARNSQMFYAQSWALVHYLVLNKPDGAGGRLDRLPEPADLPTDDELKSYARGRLADPLRLTLAVAPSECRDAFEVRSVPETESLLLRAKALADGERPDAALSMLTDVLRRDNDNPEALETLGFVHFVGNRHRESATAFDRAIATGQASHVAYYYRALLAGTHPALTDGSGPVPEMDYLRRAIRLNPGFRPALERLRELGGKSI